MQVHQLESTNAFIVFDYEDAPTSVGVVRAASKVLVDGAVLRARSVTYALATFGLHQAGASAGINAKAKARDEAVAAFVTEIGPLVAERRFLPWPGNGISAEDLAPLREHDPRPATVFADETPLLAAGAVATADAVANGLTGKRAAVAAAETLADAVRDEVVRRGGETVDGGLDAECDVLFVAGPPETVDHHIAEGVRAGVLVPLSPVPVTTRALAVLSRAGTVVVPDFVSAAAPLLVGDGRGDPVERVAASAAELKDAGTGTWLAAAERAEAFLSTWQNSLPFGRPLS